MPYLRARIAVLCWLTVMLPFCVTEGARGLAFALVAAAALAVGPGPALGVAVFSLHFIVAPYLVLLPLFARHLLDGWPGALAALGWRGGLPIERLTVAISVITVMAVLALGRWQVLAARGEARRGAWLLGGASLLALPLALTDARVISELLGARVCLALAALTLLPVFSYHSVRRGPETSSQAAAPVAANAAN